MEVGDNNGLNMHVKQIHEVDFKTLKVCAEVFNPTSALNDHVKQVHGYRKAFPTCDKQFSNKSNLNKHVRTAHEETNFICSIM